MATSAFGAPHSDPSYNIRTIGLTGSQYTRSDGLSESDVIDLNASAQAMGTSNLYNNATSLGEAAWLYSYPNSAAVRIGFTSAEYTRSNGLQDSAPYEMTDNGMVIGRSYRYSGTNSRGESAWIYDSHAQTTTRLGFTGASYTASDGTQDSFPLDVNAAGEVAGYSQRFTVPHQGDQAAWWYNPATTTTLRLGFFDASYTRSDGIQYSEGGQMNAAGQTTGVSVKFSGTDSTGQAAWFYDPASNTTRQIGLSGGAFTSSTGFFYDQVGKPTDIGTVAGDSRRYLGTADGGQAAWVYTFATNTTKAIGFYDAQHTSSDGVQSSGRQIEYPTGQIVGTSGRYSGTAGLGNTAWVYDARNDTTTAMGLTDAAHTSPSGYQSSIIRAVNPSGQAAGVSDVYSGSETIGGRTSWYFDPSTHHHTIIGLTDAVHTGTAGYRYSDVDAVNAVGQVIGGSERFFGNAGDSGFSGWFYDPATNVTSPLVFSTRSDGYAQTDPVILTDTGDVLGDYEDFSGSTDLGMRAFFWNINNGFSDLGSLVNGGLSAAGWSALYSVVDARGVDVVVGEGLRTGQNGGQTAFMLTVPEPGAVALLMIAAGATVLRRRSPHAITP